MFERVLRGVGFGWFSVAFSTTTHAQPNAKHPVALPRPAPRPQRAPKPPLVMTSISLTTRSPKTLLHLGSLMGVPFDPQTNTAGLQALCMCELFALSSRLECSARSFRVDTHEPPFGP